MTETTRIEKCCYNLSNLTNQRIYQEMVSRNKLFKRKDYRLRRTSSLQFLPVLFSCSRFLNPRGPDYLGARNRLANY